MVRAALASADLQPTQVSAQATLLVLHGATPKADRSLPDGAWELDAELVRGRPMVAGSVLRVGVRPHRDWITATLADAIDRNLGDVVTWARIPATWRSVVTGQMILDRLRQQRASL
jgi:hypothetical protein